MISRVDEACEADYAARGFYWATTILLEEATAAMAARDRSRRLVVDTRISQSSISAVKSADAGEWPNSLRIALTDEMTSGNS